MNGERQAEPLSNDDLHREIKEALSMDALGPVPDSLREAVARVTSAQPAPRTAGRRRLVANLSAIAAAAAAVAVIAVAVGLLWALRGEIAAPAETPTATLPATSPSTSLPATSPSPTLPAASPSATPAVKPPGGLVAYPLVHCTTSTGPPHLPVCTTTTWIAASDGTNPHVLSAGATGAPMGWSADGSRLLLIGPAGLVVTDATGSQLAAFPISCPDKPLSGDGACASEPTALCSYPCAGTDGFALSPDGTRVAFVRTYPDVHNASVIAILDVASGTVTELTATRATNPLIPKESDPRPWACSTGKEVQACQGEDGSPRWSPDGRLIAFERQAMSPEPGSTWSSAALFVVDADGANPRRVTPTGLYAFNPSWAPDATKLAFANTTYILNADHTGVADMKADVYSIALDGTDLAQLTDDGISAWPQWTANGQLAFVRNAGDAGATHWIMNGDGGNETRIGGSLADLSAAGCTTCVYAPDHFDPNSPYAYWQPIP